MSKAYTHSNIIDLLAKKKELAEANGPHIEGQVICLNCKHKWHAIAPVGTNHLECNRCHTLRGVWINPLIPKVSLQCHCGNMHFIVVPTMKLICASCCRESSYEVHNG